MMTKKLTISGIVLVVWAGVTLISSWVMDPMDVMGWALLCFYLGLPLVSMITTVLVETDLHLPVWVRSLWPLITGLWGYGIFALSTGVVNEPIFFLLGWIPSLFILGLVLLVHWIKRTRLAG